MAKDLPISSWLVPRLASSKTWTPMPPEFLAQLKSVFTRQFAQPMARLQAALSPEQAAQKHAGEFFVDGRIYSEEVIVQIGLVGPGQLRQINFEASMDLPVRLAENDEEAFGEHNLTMDNVYSCIDALGSLMEEYFAAGSIDEMDITQRWQPFQFEDVEIHLQYSTVNTALEAQADRILCLMGEDLVREDGSSEDAMAQAEIDTELALEVQKMIREGRHPLQKNDGAAHDDNESPETH